MSERETALRVAWHYLGTPYRWGGDDPSGLDCSGFVIECLQSVGRFPRKRDTTADGLMRMYPEAPRPLQPGDLVFWVNDSGRAYHVGMLIDPVGLYIGAEGGGSTTRTVADAWKQNAYICVRPVESRGSTEDRRFRSPFVEIPLQGGE